MYATGAAVHIFILQVKEMNKQRLEEVALSEGYFLLVWKKFQGREILCGLRHFLYTVGLVIDINEVGYMGRFCFPILSDAVKALANLPEELPSRVETIEGNWIKYKGHIEVQNENYTNHERTNHGQALQ